MQTTLKDIFLNQAARSIFLNPKILDSNFIPSELPFRENHAQALAKILAPALQGQRPSNVLIYGTPGTGKTIVAKTVLQELNEAAKTTGAPVKTVYVNTRLRHMADTEYRLVAQLARLFGAEVPFTGLPLNEVYQVFFAAVDKPGNLIIVLDEIDHLLSKSGAEVLFNLVSGAQHAQISFIGISSNMTIMDQIDPRVRTKLSPEELLFPPYDAVQITEILNKRAVAFRPGCLDSSVIPKCSAHAAREHGDACRAIELLRIASEIADRNSENKVTSMHVDQASNKLELNKAIGLLQMQPVQCKLVLYSISQGAKSSGEIYQGYLKLCGQTNTKPLTARRVTDLIAELEMLGMVNTNLISKGRYGRTTEVELTVAPEARTGLEKYLKAEFG